MKPDTRFNGTAVARSFDTRSHACATALLLAIAVTASTVRADMAIVPDQPEYQPGEIANVNGEGFDPGDILEFTLTLIEGEPMDEPLDPWYGTVLPDGTIGTSVSVCCDGGVHDSIYQLEAMNPAGSGAITNIIVVPWRITHTAADPTAYATRDAGTVTPPVGAGTTPAELGDARFGEVTDRVLSLPPEAVSLGQIVVFEYLVRPGAGAVDQTIQFSYEWDAKTDGDQPFGYDESLGVLAAFVDTNDAANAGLSGDETVSDYFWSFDNAADTLRGTFTVAGLSLNEAVVVEVWVALDGTIEPGTTGIVRSAMTSARLCDAADPATGLVCPGVDLGVLPEPILLGPVVTGAPLICDAGGPYTVEANGATAVVPLDAGLSDDPNGGTLAYLWSCDDPGAVFDDPTSPSPTITVSGDGPCPRICHVTLAVASGGVPGIYGILPSDCGTTLTIEDTIAPALAGVPGDAIVECGLVPAPAAVTASDLGAGTVPVTFEEAANGDCPQTITRTWTAVDDCGNTASAMQTLTVQDTLPPMLDPTPSDVTVEIGAVPAPPASVGAVDDCSGFVGVQFAETNEGDCPQTITRTWTAVDACGNDAVAVQVITVQDTVAPVLAGVPADITVQCDAVPAAADVTASDVGDPAVSVIFTELLAGTCPTVITRTWSATDACGNGINAVQVVTVEDTIAPVLSGVPADLALELGVDDVPPAPAVLADDACAGPVAVAFDETTTGDCPQIITRTWTASDDCGNDAVAVQTISLSDTIAPALAGVPADADAECGVVPGPPTVTADDLTDGAVAVTFDETSSGDCPNVITRTWTSTDGCGNTASAIQVVTVNDTLAPALAGVPGDVTVPCTAVPAAAAVTADDTCSGTVAVQFDETPTGDCPQALTRTWTATDDCGNTATATQVVTVEDTVAPVLSGVPADISVEAGSVPDAVTVTAADDCGGTLPVQFQETSAGACPTVITRTWSAVDGCGNPVSATRTITVHDTIAPVLSGVPSDVTTECGAVPAPPTVVANDVGDASVPVIFDEITGGDCPTVITRTWTASDDCGNTASAIQLITVQDSVGPVLAGVPVSAAVECTAVPAPPTVSALDACAGPVTVDYQETTEGDCPLTVTRTWSATDPCGNTETAVQTITVQDTTPPLLSAVPAALSIPCAASVPTPATVLADDACAGPVPVQYQETSDGLCPETITRTWFATDGCGNTAAASQIITRVDDIGPVLSGVPGPVTLDCTEDLPAPPTVTATDDCAGVVNVVMTETQTVGGGGCLETLRTWSAADACGNTTTASQTISVIDDVPPVIQCAGAASVGCDLFEAGTATAEDECDPDPVITHHDQYTTTGPDEVTVVRTWFATDACGNTSQCEQLIAVDCPGADRVSGTEKGSLLAFSKVEIRWDAAGEVIQDTFIDLTNDYNEPVSVNMYFVNGDPPLAAVGTPGEPGYERAHAGWNWVDVKRAWTANQPAYWSALTGQPGPDDAAVAPFTILDPTSNSAMRGRPATDGTDDRVLRGFIYAFAVDEDCCPISWNHIKGDATIVNYREGTALKYNAWAFQDAANSPAGTGLGGCADEWAKLDLNGIAGGYVQPFSLLLMDFYAPDSDALSNRGNGPGLDIRVNTAVTLHPVTADFRQEGHGPVTTKASYVIWNEDETQFTNLHRCVTCWDQQLLSLYTENAVQNHFLSLQTDKGKARIDGVASQLCSADCCFDRGSAGGCEDASCQEQVCSIDPFCCSAGWDLECAMLAVDICDVCPSINIDVPLLGVVCKHLSVGGAQRLDDSALNLIGMGKEPACVYYDPATNNGGGDDPPTLNTPEAALDWLDTVINAPASR